MTGLDTVLFLTPLTHEVCRDVLNGIRDYAQSRGWRLQVIEEVRRTTSYAKFIGFWKPIGCIAGSGVMFPTPIEDVLAVTPFVTIDRAPRKKDYCDCPNVCLDNAALGRLAARELLALGLLNCAFAGKGIPCDCDDECREAFISALTLNGMGVHVFPGSPRGCSGYPAAILKWVRVLPRPVGIFCTNDWVAERVIGACELLGYGIPDEVAVLGVGNNEHICCNTYPTLSSIQPDFVRAGFLAAEQLDRLLSNPRLKPQTVCYHAAAVVHRESTARVAAGTDEGVDRVLDEIARRTDEGLRVDDVVQMMRCSRRFAELRFRKAMGTTIFDHLRKLRVESAMNMFRRGNTDLRAVAEICGFGSVVNLRNAFRHAQGKSVREWLVENRI